MKLKNDLRRFLEPYKILRDPVQGDIPLTSLETRIIDTRVFQRLHQIKQLGCAYLVYPGATHTRFSHSIGTLYSAQKLINAINANSYSEIRVDDYVTLLTRACALLHDVVHIPFGHTLEDEGNLFPSQWEDNSRVDYFLGKDSEIGTVIAEEIGDKCLNDVVQILTAKDDADIKNLQYPFIADIVGDTICADILDYGRRDSYFVGLYLFGDERLINYVSICPSETHYAGRVLLRMCDKMGRTRRDVVSEILHLLRLRYSLMERVNFHHTKIAASAMIISAVYDSLSNGIITKQDFYKLGDEALLDILETRGTYASKNLISKLRKRDLYVPIFELYYPSKTEVANIETEIIKENFQFYNNPYNRWKLERKLEIAYRLPEGSVVLYCPKIKESRKSLTLKVLWEDKVFLLSDIPDEPVRKEVELIEDHYPRLWKIAIFVCREFRFSEVAKNIVDDCTKEFRVPNALDIDND